MAEIKKYLDQPGLVIYDEEIKKKIAANDAATLANAKSYADSLGVQYDPAGTAQTKVDALANGAVKTNTDDIASLKTGKADKSTTLAGYGINDAYTKAQTDSAIATAVANADHLKRTIVKTLPKPEEADEHTIYMILKSNADGDNAYDEYMVVNSEGTKKLEKIGDSEVDLTNYALKSEVATAKQEAITSATSTAATDATSKANTARDAAKEYADSLSKNYATTAQGKKADTALQKENIISGATNGSIAVGGTDVAVKGLGSAAYTASTAYEKAGAVNALATGQVATNKTDIASLKDKVANLEDNVVVESITEEEIRNLFQ